MSFRSGVSSGAGRPTESMIWIREIESATSVAELKTSNTTTGAQLHTNFEVVDSRLQKKGLHSRRSCTKRKTLCHGKAGRMDDLQIFQGQRHGRICIGRR